MQSKVEEKEILIGGVFCKLYAHKDFDWKNEQQNKINFIFLLHGVRVFLN